MKSRNIELYKKTGLEKGNKIRERNVEDEANDAALEHVCIQMNIIKSVDSSRTHHAALDCVCTPIISIQAVESSRAQYAALERVHIQH